MLKRLILLLILSLAPTLAVADADSVRDRIVAVLREDGYVEIRINRTLLGRMRFVARRPDAQREIVVNPNSGVILRDYIRFFAETDAQIGNGIPSGGGQVSNFGGGSGDDDDHYDDSDDESDDESDDDSDDESDDSSSSDSSGSGSGSDDDESDDNSGSGSSSSGSGSGDD